MKSKTLSRLTTVIFWVGGILIFCALVTGFFHFGIRSVLAETDFFPEDGHWIGHKKAAEPDLKQGSLEYCNSRASLALNIANSLKDGLALDRINIAFENQMVPEEMATAREKWIDDLKAEVGKEAEAIPKDKPDWSQRVAQKVIERCWREYGANKDRSEHKGPMIKTASSEALAKPQVNRSEQCKDILVDQIYIGNVLGSGNGSAEQLKAIAKRSPELGEERLTKVLGLIDEANAALGKNALQAWFDGYLQDCMK